MKGAGRRWLGAALCASMLQGSCGRKPTTPTAAVMQFYTILDAIGVRRVPDATQWGSLRPFVADSLANALAAARAAREAAEQAAPEAKPPFADGDPFSSLFEGRTGFVVESAIPHGDSAFVVVKFTNDTQKPAVQWRDTVVVIPQDGTLRIADIRYGTAWEFGYRGRLLEQLTKVDRE